MANARKLETWVLDEFAIARTDLRGLVLGFAPFNEREIRKNAIEMARALTDR